MPPSFAIFVVGTLCPPYPAGAATEGVGALPAFLYGMGAGIAGDFARQGAANTYAKLSAVKTADGQSVGEPAKYLAATVTGAIIYFVGKAGGEELSDVTLQGLDSLIGQTLQEAAQRPTISAALGNLGVTMGKSSLQGAAINGLMTTANMIGEQVARTITPNIKTILTDPEQQAEFKTQLIDAMEQGAEMFPLMELPGAGMHFMGDMSRAR